VPAESVARFLIASLQVFTEAQLLAQRRADRERASIAFTTAC